MFQQNGRMNYNKQLFKFLPMKIKILLLLILTYSIVYAQDKEEITSPNGRIRLTIQTGDIITWQITHDNQSVIVTSPISLIHEDGTIWGGNSKIRKRTRKSIDNIITSPFYKNPKSGKNITNLL